MQAVAASGGYYTSVACEAIVAEPTVITGSIGVIMGHFVFQQLLEEKLGIVPVILKSGEKKDWPSPFRPTTDEQKEYLKKKLITPAYNRFVDIIAQARPLLGTEDVKLLADGSIFTADEALGSGLIDRIGYLDTAIELVKEQAGIEQALVVEYRRPFSLAEFLRGRNSSALKITKEKLYELSIPELMYLWPGY
jgi:protease-4